MTIKKDLTSVNFTPNGIKEIRGLVIHSMWGTQSGSLAWFKNPKAKSSAHYCISATGDIVQTVLDTDMAWHAGIYDKPIADWLRPNPNFFTLGIELEDKRDPHWQYPDKQRQAAAQLVASLIKKYNISKDRIVLHKDLNPSRRSDPVGAFSFEWLLGEGNIEISKSTFEKLVKNSTNWDAIWEYLELSGDPSKGNDDDVTKVIGGYKSRATQMENELTETKAELKNKEDQVSRLKKQLADEERLRKSLSTGQKAYEQRLAEIRGVADGLAIIKGELLTRIANQETIIKGLKLRINRLEKKKASELSWFERLKLLFHW